MKQLTCEMCGSTDLLKQDGVFVCQTCGTKYSVEEAKKMMIEGTVEVTGTVKINESDKAKNYLEMAESAYKSGNKSEAESYCNRAIEIDPQNYMAWYIKGKVVGWQSTIANVRFDESVQCFSKSIDYAPEDKIAAIKSDAASEISSLSIALISLCCEHYEGRHSRSNATTILECGKKANLTAINLILKCGVPADSFRSQVARIITNTVEKSWRHAYSAYKKSNDGHPSKSVFSELLDIGSDCSALLKYAINYDSEDFEADIHRYEKLIEINRDCISGCAWEHKFGYPDTMSAAAAALGGNVSKKWYWEKSATLTQEAINSRNKENSEYSAKIEESRTMAAKKRAELAEKRRIEAEKEAKEQQERIEKYWKEHEDEKKALDYELESLSNEEEKLKNEINTFEENEVAPLKRSMKKEPPSESELKEAKKRKTALYTELGSLGAFKGKEKKAIKDQLQTLEEKISQLTSAVEREAAEIESNKRNLMDKLDKVNARIVPTKERYAKVRERIAEINAELTKDR